MTNVRFCYECDAHQICVDTVCTVCGTTNIDVSGTDFPDPEFDRINHGPFEHPTSELVDKLWRVIDYVSKRPQGEFGMIDDSKIFDATIKCLKDAIWQL